MNKIPYSNNSIKTIRYAANKNDFICVFFSKTGASPGGSDVYAFESVGISNSAIARNLRLQNGHKYYAVVKGMNLAGLILVRFNSIFSFIAMYILHCNVNFYSF